MVLAQAIFATSVTPAADPRYNTNRFVAAVRLLHLAWITYSCSRGNTLKSSDRYEWICAADFDAQSGQPVATVVGAWFAGAMRDQAPSFPSI